MKKQKGFTLIELLVVIAIIAILSTVVMAGLNSARSKGRDAKRLSDIKQLQTALELCFDAGAGYPTTTVAAGAAGTVMSAMSTCNGTAFSTYMNPMPTPPAPGVGYGYTGTATTYGITFTLEGQSGSLASGAHTATQSGIQ